MSTCKTQIITPVSITIRNFFPSKLWSNTKYTKLSQQEIRRIKTNFSYNKRSECIHLPLCQLDIVRKDSSTNDDIQTYYSMTSGGAHPHWNHLNEHISDIPEDNSSLFARFTVDNQIVMEIPLHPSHLKCISHSDVMEIPPSLPPNAILIHFDDGWTRVVPSCYSLLLKQQLIQECVLLENEDVFKESLFDMLGDANRNDETIDAASKESVYDDKVFDLLGSKSIMVSDHSDRSVETDMDPSPELKNKANDAFIVSSIDRIADERAINSEIAIDAKTIEDDVTTAHSSSNNKLPDLPPLYHEPHLDEDSRIQKEILELQRKVQLEQELLQRDEMTIQEEMHTLRSTMEHVQKLLVEKDELDKQMKTERINLFRANFHIETHRIHLLKHLRLIFPIKLVRLTVDTHSAAANSSPAQHQFTIAGIPLPDDVHHPATSDDQISTALGFTCHLMVLLSKYLDLPMRSKIVCKFSRSAIIDEGREDDKSAAVVYPLFRERGVVDKEQLDHGLVLLTRNCDDLLRRRQVEFGVEWNILAKLDRLISSLIDTKEF